MSFLTPELLTRFDVPGPRYTSYPTADRFVEAFSQEDLIQALALRNQGVGQKTDPCRSMFTFRFVNRFAITAHATRSSPSITKKLNLICAIWPKK